MYLHAKFGYDPAIISWYIYVIEISYRITITNSCSKRLKACIYEDVDEAVPEVDKPSMRDKNVPISGPIVIEKILPFVKALRYNQFLGGNGRLENF
ncbi:tigger transposable element-derived protein 6 [Trichonephila clavipes]|nr:tigger transposable element-derived protein 6 [Trichonephila clavipes]